VFWKMTFSSQKRGKSLPASNKGSVLGGGQTKKVLTGGMGGAEGPFRHNQPWNGGTPRMGQVPKTH